MEDMMMNHDQLYHNQVYYAIFLGIN
jgi:hypothetical protein